MVAAAKSAWSRLEPPDLCLLERCKSLPEIAQDLIERLAVVPGHPLVAGIELFVAQELLRLDVLRQQSHVLGEVEPVARDLAPLVIRRTLACRVPNDSLRRRVRGRSQAG